MPKQRNMPERAAKLKERRERQRALEPGIIKLNPLVPFHDPKTGRLIPKKLFAGPHPRASKYVPQQGKQEIARRLRQAERHATVRWMGMVIDTLSGAATSENEPFLMEPAIG